MKIKVYDIKQLNKPTVLSFVGGGVYHKTSIILNILFYWFNKFTSNSSYDLIYKPHTKITMFTSQLNLIVDFFNDTNINAKLYNSYERLDEYIKNKSYEYELNKNLNREILLLDGDIGYKIYRQKNNFYSKFKYLVKNYKKLNLTIILSGFNLNDFLLSYTKYFLFISTSEMFYEKIYNTFYSLTYKYSDFKSIYEFLTRDNGIIICKNNVKNIDNKYVFCPVLKLDKVKKIRDRQEEIRIKQENASWSDNIIYF